MNKKYACLADTLMVLSSAGAFAETVLVVNPASSATQMAPEQAAQFFLGKSPKFTPLDQAKDSKIRNDFYEKVTKKTPAQVEAIWSKAIFTGTGQPPKQFASDAEVKKAVAADVNAIGYIDKGSADGSVKVLMTVP